MLYLVATPIGNLQDITLRALEVLKTVDFIAAEDTRNTLKLLNRYDIKKPMISYFEHNIRQKGEEIISRIQKGESCALVTDAGMPAISDPGEDIVRLCIEKGVKYTIIPGACAAVCALALSGLKTGRFTFEGFLSMNKNERRQHMDSLKDEKRTMIFYEAPHKLTRTLNDFYNNFGDRKITIIREISKIYEQIIPTTLLQSLKLYEEKPPKGEFVLVLEGKQEEAEVTVSDEEILEKFQSLISNGYIKSQAVKEISQQLAISKNRIYSICIG